MAIGEAGSITTGSPGENDPITVLLTEPLTNPVFAFSGTSNGPDDYVIRLVNQTFDSDGNTTSFSFILEEWEYLDGPHPAVETINWLAIEEGMHTLADGRIIEAGTSDVSSGFRNDGIDETFEADFDAPPVILTSVMSNEDTITIDSDPSQITRDGFRLTLQEEEGQDGIHASETIGWIAIQAGGDAENGTASVTGDTVTQTVDTFGLGATFDDSVVLVETQTLDGSDTANVSIDGQSNSDVDIFIDEEQSGDAEVNHTTEVVGIIAFEDGLIPCFASGTLIDTPQGAIDVAKLHCGDLVATADHGPQVIRWRGSRRINAAELAKTPTLRPVRIVAGALGASLPDRDLLLSRQHRLLVRSPVAERMFGRKEVLIAAIALVCLPGVYVDETVNEVTYHHLLLDDHQILRAEGAAAESLYLGRMAQGAMSAEARNEIRAIFPQLQVDANQPPARIIPSLARQKRLAARHAKNGKALLQL